VIGRIRAGMAVVGRQMYARCNGVLAG
jgi:hypothetical protein